MGNRRFAFPLITVGIGVLGAAYLYYAHQRPEPGPIKIISLVELKSTLGPYAQIQKDQLNIVNLPKRSVAEGKIVTREADLVDTYTLSAVQADTPVPAALLGPKLPPGAMRCLYITSINAGAPFNPNNILQRGERVDIIFVEGNTIKPITGAYVLDISPARTTAVLGIPYRRADDFAHGLNHGYSIGISTVPVDAQTVSVDPCAAPVFTRPKRRHLTATPHRRRCSAK